MSIIEKAAAKLDRKFSKDDASIIEKAAKALDPILTESGDLLGSRLAQTE